MATKIRKRKPRAARDLNALGMILAAKGGPHAFRWEKRRGQRAARELREALS